MNTEAMSRVRPGDPAGGSEPGTAVHGVVSMLFAGLESSRQREMRAMLVLLMLVTLAGFVAISGAHLGEPWREPLAGVPRPFLFAIALGALTCISLLSLRRRPALAAVSAMLAAYLGGNLLSRVAHRLLDPAAAAGDAVAVGFILSRLLYAGSTALPMLVVGAALFGGLKEFHLRPGNWRVVTRLGKSDPLRSWGSLLIGFLLVVSLPLFFFLQYRAGFGPLLSGRLPALLVPIAFMAIANAFAEELLFRGFLQGAAARAAGAAWGIWSVAILFGLHHWGASFDPIASVAGAILVGAGSAVFGKSVVETRGLGWAICAHASINVGFFSAYYVAS